MKIKIDDLNQYLIENIDKIEFVYLNWIWKPKIVEIETDYQTKEGNFVYARFIGKELDEEYSFSGRIEDAIEYSKGYDQWNGHEFELYGPILMATNNEDVWHMEEDFTSNKESDLKDATLFDVSFDGFFYYGKDGKRHYQVGDIKKNEF